MPFEREIEKLFGKEMASPFEISIFDDCVYVEGVKRLCENSEESIVFTVKNAEVFLFGKLSIKDFGKGYIAIKGKIESVEIKRSGR